MAAPLKAPGAKSIANLKRGGQKPPSKASKTVTDEARKLSKKLLGDPAYRKTLKKRLRAGTIQPGVEALLYYYAYGKPKETVEAHEATTVKIVHQYEGDDPKK